MGDWGMKVSKPGVDVFSATKKDLVLESETPCLKFLQQGKHDFSIANGDTTTYTDTTTVSQPILPLVYIYAPTLSAYKPVVAYQFPNYFSEFLHAEYEFTSTTLYVTITNNTGSTVNGHYYWFIGYA